MRMSYRLVLLYILVICLKMSGFGWFVLLLFYATLNSILATKYLRWQIVIVDPEHHWKTRGLLQLIGRLYHKTFYLLPRTERSTSDVLLSHSKCCTLLGWLLGKIQCIILSQIRIFTSEADHNIPIEIKVKIQPK